MPDVQPMPEIEPEQDIGAIRSLLEQDPYWSLYALGDLDPKRFCHARFYVAPPHVGLLYQEFDVPILFALGDPAALLARMPLPDRCYLQVKAGLLAAIEQTHTVSLLRPAVRMRLDRPHFQPAPTTQCRRLTRDDLAAIERLYADGAGTNESPDFFFPSMLEEGVFVGRFVEGMLVSVAGTHLVGQVAKVAAIGNVYTHRNHRRRGYAAETTSAAILTLLRMGIERVGLNVYASNPAAQSVYRALGFVEHCRYLEGFAVRRTQSPDQEFCGYSEPR
jgi:ribosomal protein S18 acetylase RimI-like enzyme